MCAFKAEVTILDSDVALQGECCQSWESYVNKIISIYIIYSLHQNAVIYRIHNTLSSYCIEFSELTE